MENPQSASESSNFLAPFLFSFLSVCRLLDPQQQLVTVGYLDEKVTREERIEAAKRIAMEWRRIGQILEPEPRFESYELDGFGEKSNNRDRAQAMLDKWADKYHTRATRRHLIAAMKREGLTSQVHEIFEGNSI